jgi:hypothetical protein
MGLYLPVIIGGCAPAVLVHIADSLAGRVSGLHDA